jgi:hypothetical protein
MGGYHSLRLLMMAQVRAEQLAPRIRELQRDGYSFNGMAAELHKRKVPTPPSSRTPVSSSVCVGTDSSRRDSGRGPPPNRGRTIAHASR